MPIKIDMEKMVMGKPMMDNMVLGSADESVKIHTLKLSDGTTKSFDTKKWGVSLHHGNGF